MLPVVILAGGLATRLGDLSENIPKSLLPIAGEPFVNHQLRLLGAKGVEKVVMCVGHLGEQIKETVGDGSAFSIEILFSDDGPRLLGTGGALLKALPLLPDYFMVLYGDSYLEADYREVAKTFLYSGKSGLMTVFRNNNRFDKSNAIFDGKLVRVYDKSKNDPSMEFIDYGLNCLSKEALDDTPSEIFDLGDVFTRLSLRKQLAGFEVAERFFEIGSIEGVRDLELHLGRKT
ncbi:MAG: NTP transferase domain-containing protein [Deltaproteobacteria bacterium]|jgi:NDP-sugar pyrophosphorylase family protein|nr:NTP transferase domain-containing protein [Deltaproteobacteria bacterium]